MDKKTTELDNILNYINNEKELNRYLLSLDNVNNSFCEYIDNLCKEKNIKKSELIKNSDIARTYCYEILNGKKKASRNNIIRICIGGKFNLEETNKALKLSGYNTLYSKDRRDSLIAFAINNGYPIIEINMKLDSINEEII